VSTRGRPVGPIAWRHVRRSLVELEEKLSVAGADKARLQLNMHDKERQLLATVQATREDEWKKITEISNDK
jgi:hypothetical protein